MILFPVEPAAATIEEKFVKLKYCILKNKTKNRKIKKKKFVKSKYLPVEVVTAADVVKVVLEVAAVVDGTGARIYITRPAWG